MTLRLADCEYVSRGHRAGQSLRLMHSGSGFRGFWGVSGPCP